MCSNPASKALTGCARLKSPGSTLVDLIPVISNTICLPIVDKKSTQVDLAMPIVHNHYVSNENEIINGGLLLAQKCCLDTLCNKQKFNWVFCTLDLPDIYDE